MVELTREICGGSLNGARVAVLGAAFKPDSDDVRDSPALDVAAIIGQRGATVIVTDPEAIHTAQRLRPELTYVATADEAVKGADVALLLTEWKEYRELDPTTFGSAMNHRRILDGRNVLKPADWRSAGWTYRALGRP
jgi:UDPglucose 6-dehydrogenase